MRVIDKPTIQASFVYSQCSDTIDSEAKRNKFKSVQIFIENESIAYDTKALTGDLYLISSHTTVNNIITAKEMKALYTQQMVSKPEGRKIYDKIMSLAPLSKCPFCGIGTVTTLDHYLPKGKFPVFSVLPYNLVPSCKDCNKVKDVNYAKEKEEQTLHPYYDKLIDKQWLFAKVEKTSPVSISFFVDAPSMWSNINKSRVETHFTKYDLGKRFSIEASNALATLQVGFTSYPSQQSDRQNELEKKANIAKKLYLNSWENALYQALAKSDWYCNDGYK